MSGPRHRCEGCGGSCRGVIVRLQPGEAEGVAAVAAALGVADPIVDGALRTEGGACVFLDEADRCRIHATAGASAKPSICQQYPLVRVPVAGGVRWGVDPGCYRTMLQADAPLAALPVAPLDHPAPGDERTEAALVGLLRGSPSVGAALAALCGERPAANGLPAAFAARFVARLAAVPWGELLPRAGTSAAGALGAFEAQDWASTALRGLPPAEDAGAREGVARLVELRLATRTFGVPPVVALVGLGGALAVGAVVPAGGAGFAAGFAAWTRVMRAPALRAALVPDSATMAWLATGARPA